MKDFPAMAWRQLPCWASVHYGQCNQKTSHHIEGLELTLGLLTSGIEPQPKICSAAAPAAGEHSHNISPPADCQTLQTDAVSKSSSAWGHANKTL